jgi:hypothetical protein
MRYEISVTQLHIDTGTQQNCESCPIALAITAVVPELVGIGVGSMKVVLYFGKKRPKEMGILPFAAADFIGRFDNGDSVEPFSFTLDTMPTYL